MLAINLGLALFDELVAQILQQLLPQKNVRAMNKRMSF